jgi:hypothetical protein
LLNVKLLVHHVTGRLENVNSCELKLGRVCVLHLQDHKLHVRGKDA